MLTKPGPDLGGQGLGLDEVKGFQHELPSLEYNLEAQNTGVRLIRMDRHK